MCQAQDEAGVWSQGAGRISVPGYGCMAVWLFPGMAVWLYGCGEVTAMTLEGGRAPHILAVSGSPGGSGVPPPGFPIQQVWLGLSPMCISDRFPGAAALEFKRRHGKPKISS